MPPVARVWERLTRPVRLLRWRLSAWSTRDDRQFHDHLFDADLYDPLSDSYPGRLTIRRFADHAARHFEGVASVLDLGCGKGEITCELARRYPAVQFLGIDHSGVALDRARRLAGRLALPNVAFETGDLESYTARSPVDLITMFDAFHHVLAPEAFVARWKRATSRVFLLEPAGTWMGSWDKSRDLDWLGLAIVQIRERLEHQFELVADGPAPSRADRAPSEHGAPTEHRYTLSDFERFFQGFGLTIRGTIAGLDEYGPRPYHASAFRDSLGRLMYGLIVELEDILFERDLDLFAKHWAIFAEYGRPATPRRPLVPLRPAVEASTPLLNEYGISFGACSAPAAVGPGEWFEVQVTLHNTGWLPWRSADPSPVFASYHWLDASGDAVVFDGARTGFPVPVASEHAVDVALRVEAPLTPGTYRLAIDLVHEGVTWFSQQGCVTKDLDVDVQATGPPPSRATSTRR